MGPPKVGYRTFYGSFPCTFIVGYRTAGGAGSSRRAMSDTCVRHLSEIVSPVHLKKRKGPRHGTVRMSVHVASTDNGPWESFLADPRRRARRARGGENLMDHPDVATSSHWRKAFGSVCAWWPRGAESGTKNGLVLIGGTIFATRWLRTKDLFGVWRLEWFHSARLVTCLHASAK